jgi:hypothetical protein
VTAAGRGGIHGIAGAGVTEADEVVIHKIINVINLVFDKYLGSAWLGIVNLFSMADPEVEQRISWKIKWSVWQHCILMNRGVIYSQIKILMEVIHARVDHCHDGIVAAGGDNIAGINDIPGLGGLNMRQGPLARE